jgi:hypothetical protein
MLRKVLDDGGARLDSMLAVLEAECTPATPELAEFTAR